MTGGTAPTVSERTEPVNSGGGLPPRRRWRWPLVAAVLVLVGAGVAVAVSDPFSSGGRSRAGVAGNADPTSLYTVIRQDLSSQTQVTATLGYAGSFSIAAPSGASALSVAQARQSVTQDQQTVSADQAAGSDATAADNQAVAADQTNVNSASAAVATEQMTLTTDQTTLTTDQTKQSQACAGRGASGPGCSQDAQKVSQDNQTVSQDNQNVSSDQSQLTQAQEQLATARSTAKTDLDQNEATVVSDRTKLQGDRATLASLRATAVNPGMTYTSLPNVGKVIREDQAVYSVSNEPVPLLHGSIAAYRAFYVGMSDGADVRELTHDLIALGYGATLTQRNHYSTATATAVKRWQGALGLPATGDVLLGQVVFEPGPIRVTSVTPSVGASVGGGSGSGGDGGGTVLSATSTTRQVRIALDASQQSEVKAGDKVTIALPNNQTTPGVIASVGTVATAPASGSSDTSPTITVLVKPTDPAATGTWDLAPVNVTITTGSVSNVLVVPVDALLAQAGGGYAVEVSGHDGIHHLVPVTLGLSDDADGLVQVSGSRLAAGQHVVVPNL